MSRDLSSIVKAYDVRGLVPQTVREPGQPFGLCFCALPSTVEMSSS